MVAYSQSLAFVSLLVVFSSEPSTGFHVSPNVLTQTQMFRQPMSGNSENNPSYTRTEDIKGVGKVLKFVTAGLALISLPLIPSATAEDSQQKISLKPLPYDYNALLPYISAQTLSIHHDKHHAKYVSTTLSMIKGTDLEDADLVTLMRNTKGIAPVIFNNAAQSWNHDFYWKCMKCGGGGAPTGKVAAAISKNFGTFEKFKTQFATAGNTAFGSGWAWLVQNKNGQLEVLKTIGADNPLMDGKKPLLTMDVWEHAYYLDYQNNRGLYVDAFLDHLIDWSFVESQMDEKV